MGDPVRLSEKRARMLQDAGAGEGRGTGCPSCGCRMSEVIYVRPTPDGNRRRRRLCRYCGRAYTTVELPLAQAAALQEKPRVEAKSRRRRGKPEDN